MPTVGVKCEELFKALGKSYTEDEFAELCFQYGLELDEVTSEKKEKAKEQGADSVKGDISDDIIYKIDIPANRYDLLCIEGLARALKIFLSKCSVPNYRCITPKQPVEVHVTKSTAQIRPYFVGAILRNITFNKQIYDSFIDLQDKLHHNIGRKRQLVSIGTHDLDTISGPFKYDALPPNDIKFVPLNQTKEYTGSQLMELYSKDSHLKHFLPIIQDSPVFPAVLDANSVVCSMPPIINSEHSKITLNTKNVFIDVTATDEHKASIVLDTIVTMFSEYCKDEFVVEHVNIIRSDGSKQLYPLLPYRDICLEPSRVNTMLGTELKPEEMATLLSTMSLTTNVDEKGRLNVKVPPTRHDIIHPVDVIEDVGIAHGYNNIDMKMPPTLTTAAQFPVNKLTDQLRHGLAESGYTEALTFSLCSRDDISTKLRKVKGCDEAVHVGNPKTLEFQVARTQLLPGLLKTINCNRKMPLPLRLFEISDVVRKDSSSDVGASNGRNLSAVYYGKSSGFELIHGVLDRIMTLINIPHVTMGKKDKLSYNIQPCQDETYLCGRCAQVVLSDGSSIGKFGVLHPEVLQSFELNLPVSALEINIDKFV